MHSFWFDLGQFMAVSIGATLSCLTLAAALSSRFDRGRVVFREAQAALSGDAAEWSYMDGDSFRPARYSGPGLVVREYHPLKVFVQVDGAPEVRAGVGWSLRLSLVAVGLCNEIDKIARLNGLSDTLETMMARRTR